MKQLTYYVIVVIGILILSSIAAFYGTAPIQESDYKFEVAFPNIQIFHPVDIQTSNDNSTRLFVISQPGLIYVFNNTPDIQEHELLVFLNITNLVLDKNWEQGLLGFVFHPDYSTNGFFYVYYTKSLENDNNGGNENDNNGEDEEDDALSSSMLVRYTVREDNPNQANISSAFIILEQIQPFPNHNAGQLAFGPQDGYLYLSLGDGGIDVEDNIPDPFGNGQNRANLLGSLIRIDVDQPSIGLNYSIPNDNPYVGNTEDFREEIFAYGLRNPWRFSFDSETGDIWLADVGEAAYEEVNIIEKGKNYGWSILEGRSCYYPPKNCNAEGLTPPVMVLDHEVSKSITGGYVYRGSNHPNLYGDYIFGDFGTGRIWVLNFDPLGNINNTEIAKTNIAFTAFGTDHANEIYALGYDGLIYKLVRNIKGQNT